MEQAGLHALLGGGKFSWQDLTFGPLSLSMQPIDKRPKPLLPNHHN
jgi:hypothetical protein